MKHKGRIIVCDDNKNVLRAVELLLGDVFSGVVCLESPKLLPSALREHKPEVVLLDMNFESRVNNGNEGIFWLSEIKKMSPDTPVVLFTAYADIELAVKGLKMGASDFVVKPFDNERLTETLLEAVGKRKKKSSASKKVEGNMLWGNSQAMTNLRMIVEKVAVTDADILITGENGTGKEVLAREIHRLSHRASHDMMPIDLGAVTSSLFESELFGHVKGAFTDAGTDKPGKFELADGGTLFLDEICNLGYDLQAKLLTALQSRNITRVGGTKHIPVDVRLICATNRDVEGMVLDGKFREDLFYRINTIHLELPPLRDRKGDISALAERFLNEFAQRYGRQGMEFSKDALERIEALPWYGNIRELRHVVEKAVILTDGAFIGPEYINCSNTSQSDSKEEATGTLEEIECRAVKKAIDECEGNFSTAARQLGISRQTLYNKLKKYGL